MNIFSIILIIGVILITIISMVLRKQQTRKFISLTTKLNKNFNTLFYKIEEKIKRRNNEEKNIIRKIF